MRIHTRSLTAFAVVAVVAVALAAPAAALESGPYSMEILVDGRPLAEYPARGTTYIEASAGTEYSVRLRNPTGQRVAVALSVDGLSSIDARHTSAREAAKWILAPYQTLVLDGWQVGQDSARRFYFTTEEESYGAWLGKTTDLGAIEAAFFRERLPEPVPYAGAEKGQRGRPLARAEAEAPADEHAATGIGRRVDHRVQRVRFDAEPHPASRLRVRYEFHDALVRLGVLPPSGDPLARRERARGFEDSGFAPDPFAVRD